MRSRSPATRPTSRPISGRRTLSSKFVELSKDLFRVVFNRDVDMLCGYLCYTTLLSFIPFIILLLIAGRVVGAHDRDTYQLAGQLIDLLTPDAAAKLKTAVSELYQNVRIKRLGLTVTIPFLIFLFMKIRMLRASLMKLLGESRSFPWFLDLILLLALLGSLPLFFSVLDNFVLSQIPRSGFYLISNLSKLVLMFCALGFLMRLFLPGGTPFLRQVAGALSGAIVLGVGNRFFSHLTVHVFQMNRIYGAFASIPIFLVWIYFFWMTLITCILLCSERWRHVSQLRT